ncbi:hypothetical protein HGM15179_005280 [Zosterops borbonicus]|uniref:Uncharacterized protein n=1 Tax=Zosterops borbonicus TaxID=364589 RepID=A0A8K1GPR9_9PASS|nr:hypothetical protein HGM15179_005280 [Zosterops borbonicus]
MTDWFTRTNPCLPILQQLLCDGLEGENVKIFTEVKVDNIYCSPNVYQVIAIEEIDLKRDGIDSNDKNDEKNEVINVEYCE